MHRGLLRATVTAESVGAKVAEMMPTVPGYPRQLPINSSKAPQAANPFDDKSTEKPMPGKSAAVVSNGTSSSESGATSEASNLDTLEQSSAKTSQNGEAESSKSAEKIVETPLNVSDLTSPTEPLPSSVLELSHSIGDLKLETLSNQNTPKKAAIVSLEIISMRS